MTAVAIAGKCRVCGCTENTPCQLEEFGMPCAWLDMDRTLCTNPLCVGAVPLPELEQLHLSPAFAGEAL